MPIKAVIFDMDGVLLDSMPMHLKIWEELFKERKLPFNLEIFEEYNGMSSIDISKRLVEKFSLKEKPEKIFAEKLSKEKLMQEDMLNLFPETISVLKKLRRDNIKVAIATSALEHMVIYVKKRFGLDKHVDVFVESKDVKRTKPNPDVFLLAAKKLGVDPKDCIVVEDAVNGIIAANKAGMTSIAITTTFKSNVFKGKSDFIIKNLSQIQGIIGDD